MLGVSRGGRSRSFASAGGPVRDADPSARVRLAIVQTHPIQYFAPLHRELATRPEIDLVVFYGSRMGLDTYPDPGFGIPLKWDIPLLDGYAFRFLSSTVRPSASERMAAMGRLFRELAAGRFQAILVPGYVEPLYLFALAAGRWLGLRVLLRGESNLLTPRPPARALAKRVLLRGLFSQIDAALCIGRANRRYLLHHGVRPDKLFDAPYAVRNEFFAERGRAPGFDRAAIRRAMGVADDRPLIVCPAKLIEVKRPLWLLRAFAEVRRRHPCALALVGDGPLRRDVEAEIRALGVPDVVVTGFRNQNDMADTYHAADLLALASSHEPWGLVVNEGMACGLPAAVTDRVGCAEDLVTDGVTGFVVPAFSQAALARALERMVTDAELRRTMGRNAVERVRRYSVARAADGIVRAVLAGRSRRVSGGRRALAR